MIKMLFVVLLIIVMAMTFYGGIILGMTVKTSKILSMLERHGWTFALPEDNAEDDQYEQY
jgi:hypothetical protein